MPTFAVLTTRKRAIIALIHSVVFLLIALRGVAVPNQTRGLLVSLQMRAGITSSMGLTAIYLIVTAILVTLFAYSRCTREKLYFGFCSVSAGTGLLRSVVGDPPFHTANYIRALMLVCAVVVGSLIWRGYSERELSSD